MNHDDNLIFNQSLQTALAEASLLGFKKEGVSRNSRSQTEEGKGPNSHSHSDQNISLQVPQSVPFTTNSSNN